MFTLEGKDYVGLTPQQAANADVAFQERDKFKAAFALAQQEIAQQKIVIDLAKKDAQLSDQISKTEHERAAKFEAMYTSEHNLRILAEGFIHRGKTSTFFDRPVVQIFFKAAIPLATTFLSARK